jgi:hypothetical protein
VAAVFSTDEPTVVHQVTFHNNVLHSVAQAATTRAGATLTLAGRNNWATTGTLMGSLTASVFGADPGFVNGSATDFRPTAGSPLRNAAASAAQTAPLTPATKEYYRDEVLFGHYRIRDSANDIGAFESGNSGTIVGPEGVVPQPDAGLDGGSDGGEPPDSGAPDSGEPDGGPDAGESDAGLNGGVEQVDAGQGDGGSAIEDPNGIVPRSEPWSFRVGCSATSPELLGAFVVLLVLLARASAGRR